MADDKYSRGYRNDPHDRGGAGASGPATDPLTELARLIGQSDPFAPDRNRQPDPRQPDPYRQPTDWHAESAQHDDPQHYDHGTQDDRYAAGEPQHYADQGYGSADPYAHQNSYPDPHAGQHEAGYGEASGYAEQPYHQDPQAYQQDQPAYQQDQRAYPPHRQVYAADHEAPYFGPGSDAPQHGAAPAEPHAPVPGFPPPFPGTDPNARSDDYYDDAPAPRRGWAVTAAALVGLAVVGTAGAVAYRAVFTGGEARIITRDVAPNKVTPVQTAQDSANKPGDKLASASQNERLGPPPEQPMTIPEPPRTVPPALSQNAAPPPAPAPVLPPAPGGPNQVITPADNGGAAPRKVRTEKINPQQAGEAAEARPAAAPRTAGPTPIQPAQPRVAPPAPPANGPDAPLSLAPQGINSPPDPAPAPAAPMRTTAIASPPAVEPNHAAGPGYYVQVSAQKSEEEAKSSFRGIAARHASLLGGQQPVIRRKDLGSKGVFFGAQVGPFARDAAMKLCEDLKAAGQSCMVQKN